MCVYQFVWVSFFLSLYVYFLLSCGWKLKVNFLAGTHISTDCFLGGKVASFSPYYQMVPGEGLSTVFIFPFLKDTCQIGIKASLILQMLFSGEVYVRRALQT